MDAIGKNSKCDSVGYWKDTAIIIAWDDWGGFYDHESPSVSSSILSAPYTDYQYGFRVPMIVVSAYTPQGYINNFHHDFGDVLRFVEKNFGITPGALNFADNRGFQNDLGAFFNFSAQPRTFKPIATAYPASYFINDTRTATDPDDQE